MIDVKHCYDVIMSLITRHASLIPGLKRLYLWLIVTRAVQLHQ